MNYKTNSSGKILNMDKRGIFFLASDGEPYEFRHDTLGGGGSTGISMPVRHKDESRAGKLIIVGPPYNRWEIQFNENGYITRMRNLSTGR